MKRVDFTRFLIFWTSQSISKFGSALTAFCLTLWIYEQTRSAMAVSLATFWCYLPLILTSVFAGILIDRLDKKQILLWSDTLAAVNTCLLWVLMGAKVFTYRYIYFFNFFYGLLGAVQEPASAVMIGMLAPKDCYERVGGFQAFSQALTAVGVPIVAVFLRGQFGMGVIFTFDFLSFLGAVVALQTGIHWQKEESGGAGGADRLFFLQKSLRQILAFLRRETGLLQLMLSMALLNFFSNLTYENILVPMLLVRSGGSQLIMSLVTGVLGVGGVVGGLLVSCWRGAGRGVKRIYLAAAVSFLFGDVFMGLGRSLWVWLLAALCASVPIPFIVAWQNGIFYWLVPRELQGRTFAFRNAIQSVTAPLGIYLGGRLADSVFEPLVSSHFGMYLQRIVGSGAGGGMAAMFILTGILGCLGSVLGLTNKKIQSLEYFLETEHRNVV